jgi:PAS domain S-box-containing protein
MAFTSSLAIRFIGALAAGNMPHPTPLDPDGLRRTGFWSVFERSRIPMALVDRERRYVRVNEAVIELYQYPRAEILGRRAGHMAIGEEPAMADEKWERLVRMDELYGESLVPHANGTQMHVSYAAHATTVGDRWLALIVTLSARFQPDGPELLGTGTGKPPSHEASRLTKREREVIRLVAMGSSTRLIASELGLSSETVRTHVRNAMTKTGAHTRAHLVALALADGLIQS